MMIKRLLFFWLLNTLRNLLLVFIQYSKPYLFNNYLFMAEYNKVDVHVINIDS